MEPIIICQRPVTFLRLCLNVMDENHNAVLSQISEIVFRSCFTQNIANMNSVLSFQRFVIPDSPYDFTRVCTSRWRQSGVICLPVEVASQVSQRSLRKRILFLPLPAHSKPYFTGRSYRISSYVEAVLRAGFSQRSLGCRPG